MVPRWCPVALVVLLTASCAAAFLMGRSTTGGAGDVLLYTGIGLASVAGGVQIYLDHMSTLDHAVAWVPFTRDGLWGAAPWWLSAGLASLAAVGFHLL